MTDREGMLLKQIGRGLLKLQKQFLELGHSLQLKSGEPRNKSTETTSAIVYERMRDVLNKPGIVTTDQAWKELGGKFGYSTIVAQFRKIMDTLVSEGKAKQIKKGQWEIL